MGDPGGCLCFLLVICVSTIQKSRYESQHWFDGVEEAGFHEEAAGPGAEETAQWVLDASKWTIGNFKSIEGGYYQYYLSSYDTLSAVLSAQESKTPVHLRSKTPITVQGSAQARGLSGGRPGGVFSRRRAVCS